jgi:hypothetical protein
MNRSQNISKSKFLQGLQCPKLLWSAFNAKHLLPEVDEALQAVFDQGHEVGSLAKKLFPNGVQIGADPADFEGAIRLTPDPKWPGNSVKSRRSERTPPNGQLVRGNGDGMFEMTNYPVEVVLRRNTIALPRK